MKLAMYLGGFLGYCSAIRPWSTFEEVEIEGQEGPAAMKLSRESCQISGDRAGMTSKLRSKLICLKLCLSIPSRYDIEGSKQADRPWMFVVGLALLLLRIS